MSTPTSGRDTATRDAATREPVTRESVTRESVTREPMTYVSDAAIRLGTTARERAETRWGLILVVFMRCLAALWIVQGLLQWSTFILPHDELFGHLRMSQSAAVMFFSVIDLLAAVGLWLATPWGAILWLFAALSQIFVALSVRHVFASVWIVSDVVLIFVYFALTWQAGRTAGQR